MPPFASGKAAQQPPISPPFPPLNKFPFWARDSGRGGEGGARKRVAGGEGGAARSTELRGWALDGNADGPLSSQHHRRRPAD